MNMRSLQRKVAKENMKRRGIHKACSKTGKRKQGRSWFSMNWKDYVPVRPGR